MKAQNQEMTKDKNRRFILKLILCKPQMTRIALSKITGLTKMAVSNIINGLIDENFVKEAGLGDTSLGRKPVVLEVVDRCAVFLGCYISRSHIYAVAGDLKGNELYADQLPLHDETNDSLMKKIYTLLDAMREKTAGDNVVSIGVTSIGPLDAKNGILLNPPNFFHVKNLPVTALLTARYRLPAYLENDMNAGALAEMYFGKARDISDFIYLGVGTGIGAGCVSNFMLYQGEKGMGGEIGHITVDVNGPVCSCGNVGCLELYALLHEDGTNDLKTICRYLSTGVVTLINLFDPQCVYIGDAIANYGQQAVDYIKENIKGRYISSSFKDVEIALSQFGDRSSIIGAVALGVSKMLD